LSRRHVVRDIEAPGDLSELDRSLESCSLGRYVSATHQTTSLLPVDGRFLAPMGASVPANSLTRRTPRDWPVQSPRFRFAEEAV